MIQIPRCVGEIDVQMDGLSGDATCQREKTEQQETRKAQESSKASGARRLSESPKRMQGKAQRHSLLCLCRPWLHDQPSAQDIAYSILIPRFSISCRNRSAGTSNSCKTPPRLLIAPEASICTMIDAGRAVVRIIALISVFGS